MACPKYRKRKIHTGKKGGRYVIVKGQKRYLGKGEKAPCRQLRRRR